jgi:hypothetical protein
MQSVLHGLMFEALVNAGVLRFSRINSRTATQTEGI